MGSIMFKCPETGLKVATGMRATRRGFAETPVFFARSFCPHCRTTHEWFAKDAWVEETAAETSVQTHPVAA